MPDALSGQGCYRSLSARQSDNDPTAKGISRSTTGLLPSTPWSQRAAEAETEGDSAAGCNCSMAAADGAARKQLQRQTGAEAGAAAARHAIEGAVEGANCNSRSCNSRSCSSRGCRRRSYSSRTYSSRRCFRKWQPGAAMDMPPLWCMLLPEGAAAAAAAAAAETESLRAAAAGDVAERAAHRHGCRTAAFFGRADAGRVTPAAPTHR